MSCTRVLHAFGSHRQQAVKPVDLAVCLSLSRRPSLYQLLSKSPLKPAPHRHQPTGLHPLHSSSSSSSPIYSSSSLSSSPAPPEPRSCFRRDAGGGPSKKRVVFADAVGLALTAVRLFVPEHTASTLSTRPSLATLQSHQSTSDKLQRHRLWLGFAQPTLASQASQASLARQRDACVQLESCKVSEHSLSGKVRVNHVSVDKAVYLRVTFDSWRSHHDIPCMFQEQQQRFGGSDVDLFAFDLSLPKNIDPTEHVEFCVAFRPGNGATPLWDDNRGQNYRVCVETGDQMVNKATPTVVTPHCHNIGHRCGLCTCPPACRILPICTYRGVYQTESEQTGKLCVYPSEMKPSEQNFENNNVTILFNTYLRKSKGF